MTRRRWASTVSFPVDELGGSPAHRKLRRAIATALVEAYEEMEEGVGVGNDGEMSQAQGENEDEETKKDEYIVEDDGGDHYV